jgi:hypothetical protein
VLVPRRGIAACHRQCLVPQDHLHTVKRHTGIQLWEDRTRR